MEATFDGNRPFEIGERVRWSEAAIKATRRAQGDALADEQANGIGTVTFIGEPRGYCGRTRPGLVSVLFDGCDEPAVGEPIMFRREGTYR